MNIITKLIAGVITTLLVSLVTLDIGVTVATLVSYIGYAYLTEKVISHIRDRNMPTVLEWVAYGLVFAANILLIAGLNYGSIICLIIALISYISSLVCGYFDKKSSADSDE